MKRKESSEMKIVPVIVYGFPSNEKLEGGEIFKVGLTEYNGTPVYFIGKQHYVGMDITINKNSILFQQFAKKHDKIAGWMLALVGDLDIQFR